MRIEVFAGVWSSMFQDWDGKEFYCYKMLSTAFKIATKENRWLLEEGCPGLLWEGRDALCWNERGMLQLYAAR